MKISRKSTLTTLCAVMIGLFFAVGCSKDDPKGPIEGTGDVDYPIDVLYEEYSLVPSCQWANLAYDNKVIIINSYEEWQQYVVCPNKGTSEIDFSKQTLLLANGTASGGISEITVTSLQQNSPNEYALELEILLDDSAVDGERWAIALIVDKANEESTVELKFTEYPIEIPFTEYFIHWGSDGNLQVFPCWKNLNIDKCGVWELSVINNCEELDNYLICPEDYPEIDFAKQSLLLTSGIGPSGIYSARILLMQFARNNYELEVEIKYGQTAIESPWIVAIIIDKIDVDSMIDLKVYETSYEEDK